MADKFQPVTMRHPDTNGTATAVTKAQVAALQRKGWKADSGNEPRPQAAARPPAPVTPPQEG